MHVLVTGASSGIGEAVAKEYLKRGEQVTLVARRRDRLDAIVAAAPEGLARALPCDLSDDTRVPGLVRDAEAGFGPIDVLVNNAGQQILGFTPDTDWAAGEQLLKVNVHAPLRMTLTVLPGMVARKRGAIVDIASMAALAPTPGMFFYNASKAALAAASESLRAEVAPYGVHVVTVYPGPVKSEMESAARARFAERGKIDRLPMGSPEGLAELIADAVAHKRARVIYPRVYALSRIFPGPTRWIVDTFTPPLREG
jgi:short-subunit dehydrogenase